MSSKTKQLPVSRIVCWKCKKGTEKGNMPLKKVSKTNYVCLTDLAFGAPSQEGQSEIFFSQEVQQKEAVVHAP